MFIVAQRLLQCNLAMRQIIKRSPWVGSWLVKSGDGVLGEYNLVIFYYFDRDVDYN